MICYNQYCTEFRLNCFECIKKRFHHNHIDDVEKFKTVIEYIVNQNNECDKLIDNLNTYVESVNQSFSKLRSGIRNKYSLLKERLEQLNSQQINDFLNSIIKFTEYKQSIAIIISDQTKKLTHSFNNLYEQLKLESFNYYSNDDKNVQISKELYNKGYQLYLDRKFNQALEILDQCIQSDPNNHQSLWCKGACLRGLNKDEEAIVWISHSMLNPYARKAYVQDSQIKRRMQSLGFKKLQLLVHSMFIPYARKAYVQEK